MSVGKDSILRAANAEAKNKSRTSKTSRRSKSSGRSQRSTKGRS